jgi:hypothetical protein
METETLVKVMEVFGQLGADAKWAFIAYLGLRAFIVVAVAGTVLAISVMAARLLRGVSEAVSALKAMRDMFGIGYSGYLTSDEIRKVLERVAKIAHQDSSP